MEAEAARDQTQAALGLVSIEREATHQLLLTERAAAVLSAAEAQQRWVRLQGAGMQTGGSRGVGRVRGVGGARRGHRGVAGFGVREGRWGDADTEEGEAELRIQRYGMRAGGRSVSADAARGL